jgi:hypothetical protein
VAEKCTGRRASDRRLCKFVEPMGWCLEGDNLEEQTISASRRTGHEGVP